MPALKDYNYRIQLYPMDCTGCGNCADICPVQALDMTFFDEIAQKESENNQFALTIPVKDTVLPKDNVIGSQYQKPLFEFSGACAGCGETPYVKLVTQLFGDRMMIANATGCSSIYGGSAPSCPYAVNEEGKGPAWANSLFEDNAEYGYGMAIAVRQKRENLAAMVKELLEGEDYSTDLKSAAKEWLENKDDGTLSKESGEKLEAALEMEDVDSDLLDKIYMLRDYFTKKSIWIVGGDGWAYDIGYGGLDHVLASGENVNVLVLDTEVYSNTGGQASKATPYGAIAKFAASGKKTKKKDLGLMAMTYGYVYVASVAMGADKNQLMKALIEAEKYDGPSLIIAYAPCINHGLDMGHTQKEEKLAVETGYWPLFRYNPLLKEEGKNPFVLEYKGPQKDVSELINNEVRYKSLEKLFPEEAVRLDALLKKDLEERYQRYKNLSEHGF
jgi:pyruvate-ferredoxin/flavodoxin oxidoreductase